jgi:hypothetical protein
MPNSTFNLFDDAHIAQTTTLAQQFMLGAIAQAKTAKEAGIKMRLEDIEADSKIHGKAVHLTIKSKVVDGKKKYTVCILVV